MPKKIVLGILFLIILFYIGDTYLLPLKSDSFKLIQNSILDVREENLRKKEQALKSSYGYDDYLNYDLKYSKVLFRDVYHFNEEITIYKGTNDGVSKESLVVNELGVVGVIKKSYQNQSEVNLLYNSATSLSVKINESYGILKCKDGNLVIEGIDNKAQIAVGDKIVTSDISIYPEDVLVGYVKEITYDKYEIEQLITVKESVDFSSLNYLGILTEKRGGE